MTEQQGTGSTEQQPMVLAFSNALQYVDRLEKAQNFEQFNQSSAAAAIDAILDIFAAFMAIKVLTDATELAARTELLAFWAAVMVSMLSNISF